MNVGLLPPLMWFERRFRFQGVSVPTLTPFSALPWWPVGVCALWLDDLPEMRASTVAGSSQPRLGRKRLEAVLRP